MIKNFAIYILFFSTTLLFGQEKDYSTYHKLINKAEKKFFLDKDVDSSLTYYDTAFEKYDFIFVKDLLNAAQIACFENKPFEKYIMKSFDFGIKKEHFQEYPILKKRVNELFKKNGYRILLTLKEKSI